MDEDLPDSVDDNDNSDNDVDNDGVGIDEDNNDDDEAGEYVNTTRLCERPLQVACSIVQVQRKKRRRLKKLFGSVVLGGMLPLALLTAAKGQPMVNFEPECKARGVENKATA